jgi:pimeloyl-ACP methyl ester carboxylesterase
MNLRIISNNKRQIRLSLMVIMLLVILLLLPACARQPQPGRIEEITYQSGEFSLACDIRLPGGIPPYPIILIVQGSGPADRTEGGSYLPVFERMLKAGYAVFSCDKPGSGESTGTIDDNHVIQQRAQIVLDAIELMKKRSDIDPERIGLVGISQAGYVIPRALSLSNDIAFVVCISCPGNPGVDQTTYQIMKSAICEGVPEEKTAQLEALLTELDQARSYQNYAEYVHYREVINSLLGIAPYTPQGNGFEVIPEKAWMANDTEIEHWWNPLGVVGQASIPILAFFGDKDPQIDPIQGEIAYRQALEKAGNPYSKVVLVPGANHGMTLAKTDCLNQQMQAAASDGYTIAPEFLDTLEQWLKEMPK